MKHVILLSVLVLAGCRPSTQTNAPQQPVEVATAVPRMKMDRRMTALFPNAQVRRLPSSEAGEYYDASRNGETVGGAALIPVKDADGKKLEILLVTSTNGKIGRLVAGVPGSAGQTPGAIELTEFLQQFEGKTEVGLTKYQLRRGMKEPAAKSIVGEVRRAMIILRNASAEVTTEPVTAPKPIR